MEKTLSRSPQEVWTLAYIYSLYCCYFKTDVNKLRTNSDIALLFLEWERGVRKA